MKKFILYQVLFLFILFSSCSKENTPVAPPDSEFANKLQTLLNQEYDAYIAKYPGFPGGIAIQVSTPNGDAFLQKGFPTPITNSHHLRAYSITKTFTAAGIMLLHQRGQLDIHNYITDIIPNSNLPYIPDSTETWKYNIPFKNQIRIWDLLTHRAGVFDPSNDDVFFLDSVLASKPNYTFTLDEIIGYVARLQLSYFPPGQGYHYSNAGYVMLAKIIERVSGKSYRQFMNDEFVIPLGLKESSFPDLGTEMTIPYPFVDSWGWIGGQSTNLNEQNMTYNIGEGNMISSSRDITKFYEMLLSGRAGISLLNVTNYMMDCRPTTDVGALSVGAGLEYYNNLGYGKGGDGSGFTIRAFYDPDKKFMIIGFFNCWNYKDGIGNQSYFMEQQILLYNLLYKVKQEVF